MTFSLRVAYGLRDILHMGSVDYYPHDRRAFGTPMEHLLLLPSSMIATYVGPSLRNPVDDRDVLHPESGSKFRDSPFFGML